MRIKSLEIKNFRLFGDQSQVIDFDQDKNITIILGGNASGKTSILDAIALCMAPYLEVFPSESKQARSKAFSLDDVHYIHDIKRAPYALIGSEMLVNRDDVIPVKRVKKGYNPKYARIGETEEDIPDSEVKGIKHYANEIYYHLLKETKGAVMSLRGPIIPIVAYYGTGRGQFSIPDRRRRLWMNRPRWECYSGALLSATNFKHFLSLFDQLEEEEIRYKLKYRNFEYSYKTLAVVKYAIDKFVGDKYENPRIELRPRRFVFNDKMTNAEMRLDQLSDGYKMVAAMVADVAMRMVEANPFMIEPLESPGIVLIDEIDLHLHPQWQRKILRDLNTIFPNVQFVVTTHSPSIVLGAADIAQVIKLQDARIVKSETNLDNYDVSQTLLSDLFNGVPVRTENSEDILRKRNELLARGENIKKEEKEELERLDEKVMQFSFGESKKVMELKQKLLDMLSREYKE